MGTNNKRMTSVLGIYKGSSSSTCLERRQSFKIYYVMLNIK